MVLGIVSKVNSNGYDEIEVEPFEVDYLSDYKRDRILGAKGQVYRLTARSFSKLKKILKK